MKDWEHFKVEFDPNSTDKHPYGYWAAYCDLGYDGVGPTPEIALAGLVIALSKALREHEC